MMDKNYLDNTYGKNEIKVIRRYKISDPDGEKKYWRQWEKEMKKRIEDSSYDIDWTDSGWEYED